MPNNMPGSIPSRTLGLLGDIFNKVAVGALTHQELERFSQRKNPFEVKGSTKKKKGRKKVPKTKPLPCIDWYKVYSLLGLKDQYEAFVSGTASKSADKNRWLVPVIQGLTINIVLTGYKKAGVTVETYGVDLERAVDKEKEQRDPSKGSYWVSFQKTIEADPDQASKSAEDLAGTLQNTLLERLLLGLGVFLTSDQHLDQDNVTLCGGSRSTGGFVPRADWSRIIRKVCVRWERSRDRGGDLRSRSAVLLS